MAVNIRQNREIVNRRVSPLGNLLQRLCLRTAQWDMTPRGSVYMVLGSANRPLSLKDVIGLGVSQDLTVDAQIPAGTNEVHIMVEGAPIRYCDSGLPDNSAPFGALYPVGSEIVRTLTDPGVMNVVGTAAGSAVFISFYARRS